MVMVFTWFAMNMMLFRLLKARHPEKYKEMGEPSLFWNSSMKAGWAIFKFLMNREHKALNDGVVSLLSDSMLMVFIGYWILFFWFFFGDFPDVSIFSKH